MNEVEATVDRLYRSEWGRILATVIGLVGDFDVAEDAVQEAFASAVESWRERGVPVNPRAFLVSVARHKAIDRLRRRARGIHKVAELASSDSAAESQPTIDDGETVPDERLRLIFTCCHPALSNEAQVALTLRSLGGLQTEEIARAFLVPATTMAQRLVRAKLKIREAKIPYRVPDAEDLAERLDAVMAVLYLVFNEGYAAAQGEQLLRLDLCTEALRLTALLRELLPERWSDLDGLQALMMLHDARRTTRTDAQGDLVLLEDQDRSRWDLGQIADGTALLTEALRGARGHPGPYALQAAIAAVHANARAAADTDWRQIVALYQVMLQSHPSPVIALNCAVAVAMNGDVEAGLAQVDALSETLDEYYLWHAARADLLRRLSRREEAHRAYEAAWQRTSNRAERRFLEKRLLEVGAPGH